MTGFSILLLSACASIPLDPQAARIVVERGKAPKGCKFMGQIAGNQGNFFTGNYTSNQNLEIGSMNDMRNKAHQLGANYIQLLNSRAGITGSMSGDNGSMSGSSMQTNITNLGNAYRCPPKAIGLE